MKQRWEHWNVFSALTLSVNRKFLWGGSQNLLLLTHSCAHSWMVPGVRIQLLLENRPPWEETQPRAVSLSSRKGWSPLATLQLPEVPSCPRQAGMEAGMGWGAGGRQGWVGEQEGGSRSSQQSLWVLHNHHSTPSPAFPLPHRYSLKSME